MVFQNIFKKFVSKTFTSLLYFQTLCWEGKKTHAINFFCFKLPLQMINSGRKAVCKLEKSEQKENKTLNLEDMFEGLLKNCQRQSKLENQKCKIFIKCFYHWKLLLLLKIKNEVQYWSIGCWVAHLSAPFDIPNRISKTINFFDIFKGG